MSKKARAAKGEGSFVFNEDRTVTHRKSVGRKPNGQRKILTVTAPTKAACIREMKIKEAEWNRQKALMSTHTKDTVTELCFKHLRSQAEREELKGKSIDRRECTIQNQISKYKIGGMQIHSVNSTDIEEHIHTLIKEGKLAESSITKALDVINAAFRWAVIQKIIEENPVDAVKDSLTKKLRKLADKEAEDADVMVLSKEEEKAFIQEANTICNNRKRKYISGDFLLLLLFTGMRCGEMISLRWRDYDWEHNTLRIDTSASMEKNRNKKSEDDNNYIMVEGTTKNQKARVIELSDDAKNILRRIYLNSKWRGEDNFITPTKTGAMYTTSNLENRLKVIMKNAGLSEIKGGCHILRKTFATNKYEEGWRVEEIAAYIGDLESTTRKYYIAIRKKVVEGGKVKQVVKIPERLKGEAS